MILKRIKFEKYDELYQLINEVDFFTENNQILNKIDDMSENVLIDGKTIDIDIKADDYLSIVRSSKTKGESSIAIAKKLYSDFMYMTDECQLSSLPTSLMYEKEFWTYMNLTIFFDVIKEKYIEDSEDTDKLKGKIQRCYFNTGGLSKIDRTGLRYLWVIADLTYYNGGFELTQIAWDFIDPFKAIQECVLGNNPYILKAFALAIKKLNCDPMIKKSKNPENRKIIPKHIRNYACSIVLDRFSEVEPLADIMAKQILIIMEKTSA